MFQRTNKMSAVKVLLVCVLAFTILVAAPAAAMAATAQTTYDFYRLYNPRSGDHFLTGSLVEKNAVAAAGNYVYEGIAYSYDSALNTAPVYRIYNPRSGDHFYTASLAERNAVLATGTYVDEGISSTCSLTSTPSDVTVYRLYNPRSGDHFLTGSLVEKNAVAAAGNYVYEGIAYYIQTATIPITGIGATTGTVQVGQVITAGAVAPAGPPVPTVNYQWQIADEVDGVYANIALATSSTYTILAADSGRYIRVVVTATGSFSGTATSTPVGAVAPASLTGVVITDTPRIGATITADVTPPDTIIPSFGYEWLLSATQVGGYAVVATTPTYLVPAAGWIKVRVTGTGGYTGVVTSDPVQIVAAVALTGMTAPTGTPQVGEELAVGTLSPAGATGTYNWQWSATGVGGWTTYAAPVTTAQYTLVAADATRFIRVQATGSNGYSGTVDSAATAVVAQGQLNSIGPISGTTAVGSILSVTGTLDPTAATATYQWQSFNGLTWDDIAGATLTTYTLQAAEVGLDVRITATGDPGYTGSTVESDPVGPVTYGMISAAIAPTTPQVGAVSAVTLNPVGATVTYVWEKSATGGAPWVQVGTGATYTPVAGDLTEFLRVTVTGTGDYTGTVTSINSLAVVGQSAINGIGVITGTLQAGSALTAGTVTALPAPPPPVTVTYQWAKGVTGGPYVDIAGATASTYTPVTADVGAFIVVTATGSGGTTGSATSAQVGAITAKTAFTGMAAMTGGPPKMGVTLTAGAVAPVGATVTYQWQKSDAQAGVYTDITGAAASTYTAVAADIGDWLRVVATAYGIYTGTQTDTALAAVITDPVTAITVITGTPTVGQTLTVGTLTPAAATATYQWRISPDGAANWANIPGATGTTYVVQPGDATKFIRVIATGTGGYAGGTATSANVGAIADAITAAAISGTVRVGETLTGSVTPAGATATYQWESAIEPVGPWGIIAGPGANTYLVLAADVNRYIRLVTVATAPYTAGATSAVTVVVAPQPVTAIADIGVPGTVTVGQTLNAGALTPAGAIPTATYQWQYSALPGSEGYANIPGATAAAYVIQAAYEGQYIRVKGTGTGAYTGTVTSNPTATTVLPAIIAGGAKTIAGVTQPVKGAVPVTLVPPIAEYTGTVTWSPAVVGTFAGGQAYTATITLTANTGYTFTGVGLNSFLVLGCVAPTNAVDSGTVTALFPATAP